jgi:hypothetical protein
MIGSRDGKDPYRRAARAAPCQQTKLGHLGPGRLDVIQDGRDIGRIFKPGAGVPPDHPWMWTITGAVVMPALTSHGFCASLNEAKAKFADTWRAWLSGARTRH